MTIKNKKKPLNIVLYWHMHQPEYRDLHSGEYILPWTYLHTIKDYVDMVAHLENNSDAKAVVNFAPVLLEQIDDYAEQLQSYLKSGKGLKDKLLSSLAGKEPLSFEHKTFLVKACKRANKEKLIDRFPAFSQLNEITETSLEEPEFLNYYSEQFFVDLVVWYHLAWTAETVRMSDKRIIALMDKAKYFDQQDQQTLLHVYAELISGVIERYRVLAVAGRIELTMTPYAHPIVPLLLDLKSTEEAMPGALLPEAEQYPDGKTRSLWHMKKGIEVFKQHFGFEPKGCWPSEGSISEETVELISDLGLDWVASGETVLNNSLYKSSQVVNNCSQKSYQFKKENNDISCFFRDDGLSDLIGFKYSNWHADDAVNNFVSNLETIAYNCADNPSAIVSIILDGENAWEYYPFNGYYFLQGLYQKLSNNPHLKLTTYSEYLASKPERKELPEIAAGSWVYGTFSTWIGEKDKNRAWDMLIEAKKMYDQVTKAKKFTAKKLKEIEMQLATCESSDWFWWFGEHNSAESVSAFDLQYRLHLTNLYHLLGVAPPAYLDKAFSFGSGEPVMGGAMLPGKKSND